MNNLYKSISKKLFMVFTILFLLNFLQLYIYFLIDDRNIFSFIHMFDFDMEYNLPTLFSSFILLISAILFYIISKLINDDIHWKILSILFIFMSIDESLQIHEYIGGIVRYYLKDFNYIYYLWVLPYTFIIIFISLFFIKFFIHLKKEYRNKILISFFLFLLGAVGFDILGGYEASLHGTRTITYSFLYTIEESLEMLSIIYLIRTLLKYIEIELKGSFNK